MFEDGKRLDMLEVQPKAFQTSVADLPAKIAKLRTLPETHIKPVEDADDRRGIIRNNLIEEVEKSAHTTEASPKKALQRTT